MFCFNTTRVLEQSILRTSNGMCALPPDPVCCTSILVLYPRLVTRSCLTPLRLLMAGKCSRVCHYFVVRRLLEALRRLRLLSKKCSTPCCLRSSRCTCCPTTVSGGRWASQHVVAGTQWSPWTCSPISWLPWQVPKWEVQMIILDLLLTWWVVFNWAMRH